VNKVCIKQLKSILDIQEYLVRGEREDYINLEGHLSTYLGL
jgi:hypothetical protein